MLDIGTIKLVGQAALGEYSEFYPFATGVISLKGNTNGDGSSPADAIRAIEFNLPIAEGSMALSGQVRPVIAEPTDCPCFREPYVIPDSFSSSDQRHWKFKQAWRNGRPLLFDKRLGFTELEARGPSRYSIVGFESYVFNGGDFIEERYIAVLKGDYTSLQHDLETVFLDEENGIYRITVEVDGVNSGVWQRPDELNFTTVRFSELPLDHPYYFIAQPRTEEENSAFAEINPTQDTDEWSEIVGLDVTAPYTIVEIFGENTSGQPVVELRTQDLEDHGSIISTSGMGYYTSNTYFNIGEEDGCEPKPCFLTIQPEYICSEPTDNPVVTTQSICSGVLDGNPVFSANSIRLENDCFKICDTPPCLKRRQ